MKNKKKSGFSLRKLIYNDKYLIIFSVILAIVIWVVTSINLSPETTKTITVPVSVDFTGTIAQQLGIEYYDNDEITVDVTVSCKKYLAKDISADDINAYLQTNTVTTTGYLSVPISVSAVDDAEFTIQSYSPTSAQGYFDVAQEVTMPVELNYINTKFAAEGYVAGNTALNQSSVTVYGPASYVSEVKRVVADISLESNLTESQVITLDPVAVNENGERVDYVSIRLDEGESSLTATVPILKVMVLPTSVDFVSGPEGAVNTFDIDYSVDSVEVGALESAALTELKLGSISFNGLNPGVNTFDFKTDSINGVTVLDGTSVVTVTVTVPDDYQSKTINVSAGSINVDSDKFNISVTSLSSSRITIIAPKDIIDSIDRSALTFSLTPLNGGEINENTKQCRLTVGINGYDNCWVTGDYTVNIKATKA